MHDAVNHPSHYTSSSSGVECIEITEHMCFNLGNAYKYLTRCDLKHNALEDLRKALWYVNRELETLSERFTLPCQRSRSSKKRKNSTVSQTCSHKEWLLDYYVFFTQDAPLLASNGFRNLCRSVSSKYGNVSLKRNKNGLQIKQSGVGKNKNKSKTKMGSRNVVSRKAQSDGKANTRTGVRNTGNTLRETLLSNSPQKLRSILHDHLPYMEKRIVGLSKHLGVDQRNACTRARFYIAIADLKNNAIEDLKKAVWYIQREIAKRENPTTQP